MKKDRLDLDIAIVALFRFYVFGVAPVVAIGYAWLFYDLWWRHH